MGLDSGHDIIIAIRQGNIIDLANELNAGHKIIIPLDSGEIWKTDSGFEDILVERADHAVVLTGIDYDANTPKAIINDPGHPDGKAMKIELSRFIDAWKDSSYYYLTTV